LLPTIQPLSANSEGQAAFLQASQILDKLLSFKITFSQECTGAIGLDFACTYSFALAVIPELLKILEKTTTGEGDFYVGKNAQIQEMLRAGFVIWHYAVKGDLSGFARVLSILAFLRCCLSKTHVKDTKKLGFIVSSKVQGPFFRSCLSAKHGSHQRVLHVASGRSLQALQQLGLALPHSRYIAKNKKAS